MKLKGNGEQFTVDSSIDSLDNGRVDRMLSTDDQVDVENLFDASSNFRTFYWKAFNEKASLDDHGDGERELMKPISTD